MKTESKNSRREFLKTATVVGASAAAVGMPNISSASQKKDKIWKLKLQSNWTGIGIKAQDEAAKLFVERVHKLSNGRIQIKNFDSGVLLGFGETFKGVGNGIADLAVTTPIYHAGVLPVCKYFWGAPFFPNDRLEFMELWYQVLGGKELWQQAYTKHGVQHLTYEASDEWGCMVSTVPIQKFSDYKGLKVRAFGIWADWLVHNGASITIVPGGEIYTAIQTKILDAAAGFSPDLWAGQKLYEVCDYFINPSIMPYDACEVIMNKKKFDSMPPDLQEILITAARVHNLDHASRIIIGDGEGRDLLREKGMKFIQIDDTELKMAEEWCWKKFLEEKGKDPMIDELIAIYDKARMMHKRYFGPKRLPA